MAKYTVLSISVSGIGRKIHYNGDEVTEANFPQGNVPQLVKDGFLKMIDGTEDDAIPAVIAAQQEETEVVPKQNGVTEKKAYEDITATELKTWLTENSIEFDAKAKKEILYELYSK